MTIIGAVVLMFLTSWYLALAVVIVAPALILPDDLHRQAAAAHVAPHAGRARRDVGDGDRGAELDQDHQELRPGSASRRAHYAERAEDSYRAEVTRLFARGSLIAAVMFLVTAGLVALVWWGAKAVFDGAVTAGELTQFMIYALMATSALAGVSEVLGSLQTVAGATERLIEILDTEADDQGPGQSGGAAGAAAGHAGFRGRRTSPTRRATSETVLDDLTFAVGEGRDRRAGRRFGRGQVHRLRASSQRFYDVELRPILVDGVDIRDLDPADLRPRFAYVEQEPTIFAGTVAENIRFGKPRRHASRGRGRRQGRAGP